MEDPQDILAPVISYVIVAINSSLLLKCVQGVPLRVPQIVLRQ